jgi:putative protease
MESHSLNRGDKILITGPNIGVIKTLVEEIRVDDVPVETVQKGETFSIKVDEKIRPSAKLYKIVSA